MRSSPYPSELDHHFWAGADKAEIAKLEKRHVGGGVNQPQGAVEPERISSKRGGEALREHHLKDLASPDVGFGLLHRLAVGGAAEGAGGNGIGQLRLPVEAEVGKRKGGAELLHQLFHPPAGLGVGLLRRLLACVGKGHHPDLALDLVEDQDAVHLHEDSVGGIPRLQGVNGHLGLDPANQLIAPVAKEPADAAGQLRQVHRLIGLQAAGQNGKGIPLVLLSMPIAVDLQGLIPAHLQNPQRVAAEEAVAGHLFPSLHRFQQKVVGPPGTDPVPGRDRRFQVRHPFLVDRDEIALLAEGEELLQRRGDHGLHLRLPL